MQKTILITGASRGIGAQTALLAAEHGYQVCVNYRENEAAAQLVVDKIISCGGHAFAFKADISNEDSILDLYTTLDQEWEQISALVNNASILETQMRLDDMSADRLHRIMNTNVIGSLICAREAVKRMSTKQGGMGGAIVNISSGAAKLGSPNRYIDYAASKGAIDTFTIGLASEVAEEGIRVNAVRPGFIYTDIHADGGEPDRVERIKDQVPMKRGGHPKEVAEAILWLLSDKASYTTGSFIDVTGGH
jgi:NAD(P)-dependent dehydrogenase (short-subunit alcohol dehydrogenase family)